MGYHEVNVLRLTVKLESLCIIFFAARAGLFLLVWPLCGVNIGVFLEYFAIFRKVTGAMQQSFIFRTGRPIAHMTCIICLALSSAALLGVSWQGGLSSLTFPAMAGTFSFYPGGIFRSVLTS